MLSRSTSRRPHAAAGFAALFLALAAASPLTARECGTLDPKPSDAKCHLPRDCASGFSIDAGKFTVGVGGGDSQGVEACCRILEYIPAHNEKKSPAEYKLKPSSVSGWTKVGTCEAGSLSILGIITIPLGTRTCVYGEQIETTVITYETDGYCDDGSGST
jgi:hypothetical protein